MVAHGAVRAVRALVAAVAAFLAAPVAWQLVLLGAAAGRRAPSRRPSGVRAAASRAPRAVVLVPAHDEEPVIGATLASLQALDPPAARIVVIADHCTDSTAEIARSAGVSVLERDGGARGKGAALAWAVDQLKPDLDGIGALVVVDADCEPTPNLLAAIGARLEQGAQAVQVGYLVANPEGGPGAALRDAAFRIRNAVRPSGQDALGLSAGLLGTGMAFTPALLERVPWRSTSVIEDAEQHLELVSGGDRVAFAPEASVRSPMPETLEASADQQLRWASSGSLTRTWAPRLAREAIEHRDPVRAGALFELLLPAQSSFLAAAGATLAASVVVRARAATKTVLLALAGHAVFVLGGMAVSGAPRSAYRALLHTPALVVQRLGILARLRGEGEPATFVRTERGAA